MNSMNKLIAYYVYPIRFEERITKNFHILAKHSHTSSVYLLSMEVVSKHAFINWGHICLQQNLYCLYMLHIFLNVYTFTSKIKTKYNAFLRLR